MASPFRAFRKYQKAFLVVAGVILMFVFVLGDPLSQYLRSNAPGQGGPARSPNAVAVKWNDGQLTNAELGQLVMQRLVVNNFLRNVEGMGVVAAQQAGAEPQPLRVAQLIGPETAQQGVEQDVVRTHLMAEAARKAGMAISDPYILEYLSQLGRGYVSLDDIRAILNSIQVGGRQTSIDFVLDAVRHEMLARNYLASYSFALETELPEDRWRDWLRVNDRVTVDAVALPAESFLVDVKDPSEEELKAFFEEYKEREPRPDTAWGIELPSPDPAFRVPPKVAVQYLMANYDEYVTKAEEAVTDAEIEKFYEDNKDHMFESAGSLLGDEGDLTGKEEDAETIEAEGTSEEAAAPETDAAAPESDATPATGDETKAAPETNEESRRVSDSPFRLVAFQEEAGSAPAAGEEASNAPQADANAATTTETPAAAEKKYQPLDEVRDEIRRLIAETKVAEQLGDLTSNLESKLNESYTNYFGATLDAEDAGKERPEPPADLADLTQMAKDNNLLYEKTEAATWQQLRDTPVGNSTRPEWGGTPLYLQIFSPDFDLYEPVVTQDLNANRYITLKTADIKGKVPKLEEVRGEVIKAWKLREAGKLAAKRAEELAKAANEKGGSLTDAIAGDSTLQIVKTDPFAFFTIGAVSRETQQVQSFRLSEPDGIVAAGPEFMEKVFDLKEGEVGAVANHDDSVSYVVKVTGHQNSLEELRQAFLGEDYAWYGVPVMARGHYQTALRVLVTDFLKSADIDWVRDPDQVMQQAEEGSEADAESTAEEGADSDAAAAEDTTSKDSAAEKKDAEPSES
jgi:hypothetical protein